MVTSIAPYLTDKGEHTTVHKIKMVKLHYPRPPPSQNNNYIATTLPSLHTTPTHIHTNTHVDLQKKW